MISTKEFDEEFDYKEYTNLCRVNGIIAMSKYGNAWIEHWESIKNKGIVR